MMRRAVLYLLLAVLICLPAPTFAQSATIIVREVSEVIGPDILLGEVAQIDTPDEALAGRLSNVKVANVAAPGEEVILTAQLLSVRLAGANVNYWDLDWQIPDQARVITRSQTVAGETLAQLVKAYIDERLDRSDVRRTFQVEAEKIPRDNFLPLGSIRYEVELPYGIRYNAPTNASVKVYVDEVFYVRVPLRFQVGMFDPVVVAGRSIAKGEMIAAGDVYLQNLDGSRLAAGYITELNQVIGMVARRNIPLGTPMTKSVLDREIIVHRSDLVNVIVNVNGVEIKVEGQAMQDGRAGQTIRVKNLISKRVLMGKVVDEKTVRVTAR